MRRRPSVVIEGHVAVADDATLGEGVRLIAVGGPIRILSGAVIGDHVSIVAHAGVTVGRDCRLADGVRVEDFAPVFDDPDRPTREQGVRAAPVVLGDGVRLGPGAVISGPGVTVGDGALIAAHVVVEADVAAGETVEPEGEMALAASDDVMCSELSEGLGEPLDATAPAESLVLAVECPGAWDRDPVKSLSARLPGIRVLAVRRTTTRYTPARRQAWLAGVTPGARFLERIEFGSDEELLELDLAAGKPTGTGFLHDGSAFLCCTHGTRDRCCARRGVPLHRAMTAHAPGRTWHSSHLGGHRFAATMAVLPLGVWLGRVPPARSAELVAEIDGGHVPPELLRGRAGFPAAAQAADVWMRRTYGIHAIDAIELAGVDGNEVRLRVEGEEHVLEVRYQPTGVPRPVSCGEGAKVEDPGRWIVGPGRRA